MSATLNLTRTGYSIGLDARHDLYAAGMDTSDGAIERFVARYEEAAAAIAAEKGVTIDVVACKYDGPAEDYDTDDEATELWQAIHDRVS